MLTNHTKAIYSKSELQKLIDNRQDLIINYEVIDRQFDFKRFTHFEQVKITRRDAQLFISGDLLYINIPSRYKIKTINIDMISNITEVKAA